MKISITHNGIRHSILTNSSLDYNDPETIDDTNSDEILIAFKSLLLSMGFQEESIMQSILNLLENEK
jgi:hypothetical protein